jgi:hypothetical protein
MGCHNDFESKPTLAILGWLMGNVSPICSYCVLGIPLICLKLMGKKISQLPEVGESKIHNLHNGQQICVTFQRGQFFYR